MVHVFLVSYCFDECNMNRHWVSCLEMQFWEKWTIIAEPLLQAQSSEKKSFLDKGAASLFLWDSSIFSLSPHTVKKLLFLITTPLMHFPEFVATVEWAQEDCFLSVGWFLQWVHVKLKHRKATQGLLTLCAGLVNVNYLMTECTGTMTPTLYSATRELYYYDSLWKFIIFWKI